MNSATPERLEFAPPPVKGSLRALALALFVHLLLIAALTWGVHWKHTEEAASFEAELWSTSAQQAAPAPAQTAPPEAAPAAPKPVATPRPAPLPHPVKAPEAQIKPAQREAAIALEKEQEKKRQQRQEAERQHAKKQQAELQAQQDKERQKKKEQDHKNQEALALRKAAEKAKQAEQAAEQKLQAKILEKEKHAEAAASEKRHQEAINRVMGLAASSGSGSASKGPSAGYGGKVRAKVLPNVVFTDEITGNPEAEVEVRTTADGTIMSQRVIKSSGNQAWNDAVLKAIVRTGSLPRDVDGQVPTPMIIVFRPRN